MINFFKILLRSWAPLNRRFTSYNYNQVSKHLNKNKQIITHYRSKPCGFKIVGEKKEIKFQSRFPVLCIDGGWHFAIVLTFWSIIEGG